MEKLSRRQQIRHGTRSTADAMGTGAMGTGATAAATDWAKMYMPDDSLSIDEVDSKHLGVEQCLSILVETGVYSRQQSPKLLLDHNHRDFIMDPELIKPTLTVANIYEAIEAIFEMEGVAMPTTERRWRRLQLRQLNNFI